MVHKDTLALGNTLNRKFPNWRAWQNFFLAYDDELSKDSQAVIQMGTDVPAGVRTAARKEVSNIKVLQKLVRKAKSTDGLNATMKGTDLIAPLGSVLDHVGDQCGSTQWSMTGVSGTEVPVTAGSGTTVSGTAAPLTTSTLP
jgi:hypothetical protein